MHTKRRWCAVSIWLDHCRRSVIADVMSPMENFIQHDPDVFTVDAVFSFVECQELIARAESIGFEAASVRTTNGPQMMTKIRNNDRVVFQDESLANEMLDRIASVLPSLDGQIPVAVDSNLRFYRYFPGQKFNRHKDGSVTNEKGETSKLSYLVYLNRCDGGDTIFREYIEIDGNRVKKEIRIGPKPGTALLFRHKRWHEGSQVATGVKYVLRSDIFYARMAT